MRLKLLAASALVPFLGLLEQPPDVTLLIYSAFVGVQLARRSVTSDPSRSIASTSLVLVGAFVAAGLLVEVLSWLGEYLRCTPDPALLHPQLVPDLALAVGFYGAWAIGWALTLARFHFTLPQSRRPRTSSPRPGRCCDSSTWPARRPLTSLRPSPPWRAGGAGTYRAPWRPAR